MVFSKLLFYAAQTIASNPKVREKALDVAKKSWEKVEPKVTKTSKKINEALNETSDQVSVKKDPVAFAEKFYSNFKNKK